MKDLAVLLIHFGTSYSQTRKRTHQVFFTEAEERFPRSDIFQAYSSHTIRHKLKERREGDYDSPDQALTRLKNLGYQRVVAQPTYIIPGYEYDKLEELVKLRQADFQTLILGHPLLYREEDYQRLVHFFTDRYDYLESGQALLLMGHGTGHPQFVSYAALDYMFQGRPIFVACVESYPRIRDLLPMLERGGYQQLILRPLMIVAGDHAHKDMAGDSPEAWVQVLQEAGFDVQVELRGLGEESFIRQAFFDQVEDNIRKVEKK